MPFLQTLGGGSVGGFKSTSVGGSVPAISASGGDSTGEYDADGFTWKYHKFTTTGNSTFTVSSAGEGAKLDFFMVGGGGGGAGGHDSDWFGGGGGGAGGVVLKADHDVTTGSFTVTVGVGGAAGSASGLGAGNSTNGGSGGDTFLFGYTAKGGGNGGISSSTDYDLRGGSGGGSGSNDTWDSNTAGSLQQYYADAQAYGSDGGRGFSTGANPYGAGGGGALGVGGNIRQIDGNSSGGTERGGGHGGEGLLLNLDGTNRYYACGGGGGGAGDTDGANSGGKGGQGWQDGPGYDGNRGGTIGNINGVAGTNGTGNGGGGGQGGASGVAPPNPGNGSAGGSGCVIIRYKIADLGKVSDGTSSENYAESAEAILAANPSATSGVYWVKPYWYTGSPFQVYCNMTTDGGGWMMLAYGGHTTNINGGGSVGNRKLVPFNKFGNIQTSRAYEQDSFCRMDLAKYFKGSNWQSQLMWTRTNDSDHILIHSIQREFYQVMGQSPSGYNAAHPNPGGDDPISTQHMTWSGPRTFDPDGSSAGVRIDVMKMSNSGENNLVTRSNTSSSPHTCRYESGSSYPGIAWNSSYNDNTDNQGSFTTYLNRRQIVYWETNGTQTSGQWFHGSYLSFGEGSSPFGSQGRKDCEIYFKAVQ